MYYLMDNQGHLYEGALTVSTKEEPPERRKHERYQVEDSAFVLLWPPCCISGQVVDISAGGLAFRYLAPETPLDKESDLEIVCTHCDFGSGAIPFRTISDVEMGSPSSGDTLRTHQRRRGVQFRALTEHEKSQIEYFIRNHGKAVVR